MGAVGLTWVAAEEEEEELATKNTKNTKREGPFVGARGWSGAWRNFLGSGLKDALLNLGPGIWLGTDDGTKMKKPRKDHSGHPQTDPLNGGKTIRRNRVALQVSFLSLYLLSILLLFLGPTFFGLKINSRNQFVPFGIPLLLTFFTNMALLKLGFFRSMDEDSSYGPKRMTSLDELLFLLEQSNTEIFEVVDQNGNTFLQLTKNSEGFVLNSMREAPIVTKSNTKKIANSGFESQIYKTSTTLKKKCLTVLSSRGFQQDRIIWRTAI